MQAKTKELITKAETIGFCVDIDVIRFKTRQITEIELQNVLQELITPIKVIKNGA